MSVKGILNPKPPRIMGKNENENKIMGVPFQKMECQP
jgi:hypothetical protein